VIVLAAASSRAALAESANDECPAHDVSWTEQNIQQCIDGLTTRIDQASPNSAKKAELLAQRAQLHENLGPIKSEEGRNNANAEFDAALADYAAAIALAPRNTSIRYRRANLLMRLERGDDALKDADALVAQDATSVTFHKLRGTALALLKRDQEAIEVYTHAIALAQSCAEASQLQRQANAFRHAFDSPLTKEQMIEEIQNKPRPLYDVPEPAVLKLGFSCAPIASNTFEDLVVMKGILFELRGESHRTLGNTSAALADYKYAVTLSTVRELGSVRLCDLELEMQLDFEAVEDCRWAFDLNTFPVFADPSPAAKIGKFLLDDGDLKGSCRIAFPFMRDKSMQAYLDDPDIKALQKRVENALQAAGIAGCQNGDWRAASR
jgi:tetratricopeptide (TPR) repeat protein